mgnify:CR=1 FL=1
MQLKKEYQFFQELEIDPGVGSWGALAPAVVFRLEDGRRTDWAFHAAGMCLP